MAPEFKTTILCVAVVLAAVIFGGAAIVTFMANPSVYAGLALVPAGFGVYTFVKKYYPKDEYDKAK